jgi:hypothetical protein
LAARYSYISYNLGEFVMRFARLALFALVLSLMPHGVWAQAAGQPGSAMPSQGQGMLVSEFDCRPTVPCEQTDANFPSTQQVLAGANACINRFLQVNPNSDVFDQSGLDSNGCLATNPQAFPHTSRVSNIPQCCIRKIQAGVCILHCTVIAQ